MKTCKNAAPPNRQWACKATKKDDPLFQQPDKEFRTDTDKSSLTCKACRLHGVKVRAKYRKRKAKERQKLNGITIPTSKWFAEMMSQREKITKELGNVPHPYRKKKLHPWKGE